MQHSHRQFIISNQELLHQSFNDIIFPISEPIIIVEVLEDDGSRMLAPRSKIYTHPSELRGLSSKYNSGSCSGILWREKKLDSDEKDTNSSARDAMNEVDIHIYGTSDTQIPL